MSDPIPLLLFCPACSGQHVDEPQPEKGWTNPPHRSHECQHCGFVWRPADVPTTGVVTLLTTGKLDQAACGYCGRDGCPHCGLRSWCEAQSYARDPSSPPNPWPDGAKERAYLLDPECWVSYSGKPRVFKRAMDLRRTASLKAASEQAPYDPTTDL